MRISKDAVMTLVGAALLLALVSLVLWHSEVNRSRRGPYTVRLEMPSEDGTCEAVLTRDRLKLFGGTWVESLRAFRLVDPGEDVIRWRDVSTGHGLRQSESIEAQYQRWLSQEAKFQRWMKEASE